MSQPIPTQELIAKDLHDVEWHFKHIFRGNSFVYSVLQKIALSRNYKGWNSFVIVLINRPTSETFTYHRVEYFCFFKEISGKGFFCILKVSLFGTGFLCEYDIR